jgi:DNA polymerase-3 subunit alpha
VTVYQEQVMLLSRLLANFTRGESDQLRKAMGKKIMKMLEELKPKFINGGKANGHDPKVLEKIWADWEKFASYAFNKSHAACYSWVAYQTAYLKAHYPAEFMAANLTVAKDDIKDVTKFMDECKAMRMSVLPPDVNESGLNFTVTQNGDVRFGLGGVKGVGEGAVEAIISEREKNGKYKDIFDFVQRVNLQACNKKTIESLALAGGFDCFDSTYREQLLSTNAKGENTLDVLIRFGNKYQQDQIQNSMSLFGDLGGGVGVDIQYPELPQAPRWSTIERLNKEKNLIGIFLSAHPLDEWEFEVRDICTITAAELTQFEAWRKPEARTNASNTPTTQSDSAETEDEEDTERTDPTQWILQHENRPLFFGGIVVEAIDATSKKGHPYGRYTIEDYTGSYQFALFGNAYKQYSSLLKPNLYVLLQGTIQQYGSNQKWFQPKPHAEAEYEMAVQQVDLMSDAQKHVHLITLDIPIENIQTSLIDDLAEKCEAFAGNIPLHLRVFDEIKQNLITLIAPSIRMDRAFYQWIKQQENEDIFTHIVQ